MPLGFIRALNDLSDKIGGPKRVACDVTLTYFYDN